jgi:xanthine dehydrogenase YagT iron-sulfur-binding subunit
MALCLDQQLAQAAESMKSGTEIPAGTYVPLDLNINQNRYRVLAETRWTLLFVLREKLGLTGSKEGCGRGECGACTVLMNGIPRYACMTLAIEAQEAKIETVEGLMQGEELSTVQQAFVEEDAFQCGYCTPGQVVAAEGLLRSKANPGEESIRIAMSGNLCRCGAYAHIAQAVKNAAKKRS